MRHLTCLFLLGAAAAHSQSRDNFVLILDASGSMWGRVGGETKVEAARRVVGGVVGKLPAGAALGLVAYGHRRKGDCADIETIVPAGSAKKDAVPGLVNGLGAVGMTPITKSFEQAAKEAAATGKPATIVLVTDGLETCGGDPCAAVRAAKASGSQFVLHIVGFDVAKENVSSLECAAQAGGGLYVAAEDAAQLTAALEQTMVEAPPAGEATLAVKSVADGKLHDSMVLVRRAGQKEIGGRTYADAGTNPRRFSLPAGAYDIVVRPLAVQGGVEMTFEGVSVEAGKVVEKVADFSTGEIAVLVTRNGALSDATVQAFAPGQRAAAAAGRSYTGASSNPRVFRLPPGRYDVSVKALEVSGAPERRYEGVVVTAGGRAEVEHAIQSGEVKIGAARGAQLLDATVQIADSAGKSVDASRTYTAPTSNPKAFTLLPGSYRATVKPLGANAPPAKTVSFEVKPGSSETHALEFAP